MKKPLFIIVLCLVADATLLHSAQINTIRDISYVYALGKINGREYRNDYFDLTLTTKNAEFTRGSFINEQGKRARLVDAEANSKVWEEHYEIAVLADSLAANPRIRSPEQYLRAVRRGLEKEGLRTIGEETSVEISGLRFAHATMQGDGKVGTSAAECTRHF